MTQSPLRRAAILLQTLPPEAAAKLLSTMAPDERRRVREESRRLGPVDENERQKAISAFMRRSSQPPATPSTTSGERLPEFAPSTIPVNRIDATLTSEAADESLAAFRSNFDFLGAVSDENLQDALRDQPASAVAVVIANLPPSQAARLLRSMQAALRGQVITRLSKIDAIAPDALVDISEHLQRLLAQTIRTSGTVGRRALRAIAGHLDDEWLRQLVGESPELAASLPPSPATNPTPLAANLAAAAYVESEIENVALKIAEGTEESTSDMDTNEIHAPESSGWVFEELQELAPHLLRRILAEVPSETAVLALLAMRADVAEAVLNTLPRRQAKQVRREIAVLSPILLTEVDAARNALLLTANNLRAHGMLAPSLQLRPAA